MASILTLTDVRAYLNIKSTADDAELTDTLDAAVAAVENIIGPLGIRAVSEEIDDHGPRIVLTHTPALSLTSVMIEPWLGATPIDDTAAWRLNPSTGVLRRVVAGGSLPFYGRGSIFTVTYLVGRGDVPAPIARAILLQVADMWKSQRGAKPLPVGGDSAPPPMYAGNRGFLGADVMELLTPYLPPPGVA